MGAGKFVVSLAAVSLLFGGPLAAQEADEGEARESETCLSLARIHDTDVLDDYHIVFNMHGGDIYLNTLPHRCPQLGFEERFSYSTSLTRLCSTDIITVLFSSPPLRGASCGLGTFVEISEDELKALKEEIKAGKRKKD